MVQLAKSHFNVDFFLKYEEKIRLCSSHFDEQKTIQDQR